MLLSTDTAIEWLVVCVTKIAIRSYRTHPKRGVMAAASRYLLRAIGAVVSEI